MVVHVHVVGGGQEDEDEPDGQADLDSVRHHYSFCQSDKGNNRLVNIIQSTNKYYGTLGTILHASKDILLPGLRHVVEGVIPLYRSIGTISFQATVSSIHVQLKKYQEVQTMYK